MIARYAPPSDIRVRFWLLPGFMQLARLGRRLRTLLRREGLRGA